jgi:chromosome segregation ATPase
MPTDLIQNGKTYAVEYAPSEAAIAQLARKYEGLACDDATGYQLTRAGIAELRGLRGDIEKRRVELKADALAWGRKVDAEARRITGLLLAIEEPMKAKKQLVDDERERVQREAEDAERLAAEAELKQARDALEASMRQAREKEEARLKAESERLAAERAELDKQRAAQEAARQKIDEERRQLDAQQEAERQRLARIEWEKLAQARADREAADRLEQQRQAADRDRVARERREQEAREAAPDAEKIQHLGAVLSAVAMPLATSKRAKSHVEHVRGELAKLAAACEGWK